MKEIIGDIFDQPRDPETTAICFTSNGIVKADGSLTMGAGIAKVFRDRYPVLAFLIGHCVKQNGNHVYIAKVFADGLVDNVCSFPTKHNWKSKSDLGLIKQSALELVAITDASGWNRVYLPFPGIGMGGCSKEEVRKIIQSILDDRFYILTLK